jgi:hypothetical protein
MSRLVSNLFLRSTLSCFDALPNYPYRQVIEGERLREAALILRESRAKRVSGI